MRQKSGSKKAKRPFSTPRRSEKTLEKPDRTLLPGHAVRDAGGVLELIAVLEVPPEVPEQRLLVRVLRRVTKLPLGLLYGDEGVLGGGLVHPPVERREPELVEDPQTPDRRRRGEADYLLAVPGVVEDGLVVLFHRGELLRPNVEGFVDLGLREREAEGDGVAEVLDVEELVAVVAAPDHGEVVSGVRPVVEQREDAEALRADKGLGADDRDRESSGAVLQADHLRLDLGLPVRTHALQLVRLVEGMVVRYPVDRRRGDVYHALHPVPQGRVEHVTCPLDAVLLGIVELLHV